MRDWDLSISFRAHIIKLPEEKNDQRVTSHDDVRTGGNEADEVLEV